MASCDDFNAEFSFMWKIKNFSHCLPWTWLRSPSFTVETMDKTKWCLQLWPKEYTNGIHMEYYLARDGESSGPQFIRVAFELSFLDAYGIQLVTKKKEATLERDDFKGFPEFVEQVLVYNHMSDKYLPDDTLTACCRMRQVGGQLQKSVFCSATSVVGVERKSFDWKTKNFSRIRPGIKRIIRIKDPVIKVELYLTAKPEAELQFLISHAHMDEPNMTDCKISVINAFGDTAYSKMDSRCLEGKIWEFPIFLKRSQLLAEKNVCLRNDVLTTRCDISISLGIISSVIDGYRSRTSSLESESHSSIKNEDCSSLNEAEDASSCKKIVEDITKELQTLRISNKNAYQDLVSGEDSAFTETPILSKVESDDSSSTENEKNDTFDSKSLNMEETIPKSIMKNELEYFYRNGTFSDVNLVAGNETFPAHRLQLSLKSGTFKEIFVKDLTKSRIILSDLDPDILRDLLDFIYTDCVRNMCWEKVYKLLVAAENYQVEDLKSKCLSFIKENIDQSNACHVLVHADKQQDTELKILALDFIVSHGKAIMNTSTWDDLTKTHIKLAFEVMQKLYFQKTENMCTE